MLVPVTRKTIFNSSAFADRFVSDMQQSYAKDYDLSSAREKRLFDKLFDHLRQSQPQSIPIEGHCVLAYPAKNKPDYIKMFSPALISFFSRLDIHSLYLMDFVRGNLRNFPFRSFHNRNIFKRISSIDSSDTGYMISTEDLNSLLPLFYFSKKFDAPIIFLLTADQGTPVSLRLCKDGNFHANFHETDTVKIKKAASEAGLLSGDIDICSRNSTYFL